MPPLPRRIASKLSIVSISTPSSSSSPTTSDSPLTPSEAEFATSVNAGEGMNEDDQMDDVKREEQAREIGRVLTPEEDPFKKSDIWIEKGAEGRRESVETIVVSSRRVSGAATYSSVYDGSGSGSGSGHDGEEEAEGEEVEGSDVLTPRPTIRVKSAGEAMEQNDMKRKRRGLRTVRRMLSMSKSTWSPFSTPPHSRSSTPSPSLRRSRSPSPNPILGEPIDPILIPLPPSSDYGSFSGNDNGEGSRSLSRAPSVASFVSSSTGYEFDGVTPFLRRSIKRSSRQENGDEESREVVERKLRTRMGSPFPFTLASDVGAIWSEDAANEVRFISNMCTS